MNQILRYWPIQRIGMWPIALGLLGSTIFILSEAITQNGGSGYMLGFVFLFLTIAAFRAQFHLLRSIPMAIAVTPTGLTAKAPLQPLPTELRWDELTEMVSLPIYLFDYPQFEIRSRTGQTLRLTDTFPHRNQLIELIRQHAPQCRISIEDSLYARMRWKFYEPKNFKGSSDSRS